MLLIGIVPKAYAAELPTDSTIPEETVSEAVENTAVIDPAEPTEPTEPTVSSEPAADTPMLMAAEDDYGIMTVASTQSGIMLFDYSDNGNYTSSLNSQITVGYKWNGTGSTKYCYLKNFGWHFARINNVPYADDPLYCIEPHRDYAASTSGNSVDWDVTMSGSGSTTGSTVWYSLDADRREAIGLILLYSNELWDHSISVTTTSKANNPNVPLRMATQFLIFEIICGLRDAETFVLNSSNECGYGIAEYLMETYQIPAYMSRTDYEFSFGDCDMRGRPDWKWNRVPQFIDEDCVIDISGEKLQIVYTPGHTPGGLSFILPVYDDGRPMHAALWGGTSLPADDKLKLAYRESLDRFKVYTDAYEVDAELCGHPFMDTGLERMAVLHNRVLGVPNPFAIGREAYLRYAQMLFDMADEAISRIR